jgi:hypothetical protein
VEAIMAESSEKQTAVERVEKLADEVLASLEAGRQSTVEALRNFTSTLQDATSKESDPSRRQALINAAVNLADELSSAQMQLLHSITGSVTNVIRGPLGETKPELEANVKARRGGGSAPAKKTAKKAAKKAPAKKTTKKAAAKKAAAKK